MVIAIVTLAAVGGAGAFLVGSLDENGSPRQERERPRLIPEPETIKVPANFEKFPPILPVGSAPAGQPNTRPYFQLTERGYQLVRDEEAALDPVIKPVNAASICGSIDYGLPGPQGLSMVEGYSLACGEVFQILAKWLREGGKGAPEGWVCWRAWWPRTEEILCESDRGEIGFRPE